MKLLEVPMDLIIRRITKKRIYYTFPLPGKAGEVEYVWRRSRQSTFDASRLVIDQRYSVDSIITPGEHFDHVKRKWYWKDDNREWVMATPKAKQSKLSARTAKEREFSEVTGFMQLVDDGQLFDWHPGK